MVEKFPQRLYPGKPPKNIYLHFYIDCCRNFLVRRALFTSAFVETDRKTTVVIKVGGSQKQQLFNCFSCETRVKPSAAIVRASETEIKAPQRAYICHLVINCWISPNEDINTAAASTLFRHSTTYKLFTAVAAVSLKIHKLSPCV